MTGSLDNDFKRSELGLLAIINTFITDNKVSIACLSLIKAHNLQFLTVRA